MSQSCYFKSRPEPVKLGGVGGGSPTILENAYSGGIGMKLGGETSRSPRYGIDIIGTDLFCLGEVNSEKLEKMRHF